MTDTTANTIILIRQYLASINKLLDTISPTQNTLPPVPPTTPRPPTPQPTQSQACFRIDIHCEKPGQQSSKYGVILSSKDFDTLKHNDHYFAVIPANPQQITAVPSISIHELTVWIAENSLTPVPDVPANHA